MNNLQIKVKRKRCLDRLVITRWDANRFGLNFTEQNGTVYYMHLWINVSQQITIKGIVLLYNLFKT